MSQRSRLDFGVSKKRKADDESVSVAKKTKTDASSKSRVFQDNWPPPANVCFVKLAELLTFKTLLRRKAQVRFFF